MLQRKQTLWLLLAVICAGLSFKLSFFSGNKVVTTGQPLAFVYLTATGSILLLILTIALITGMLVTIFNYKDRKTQLRSTIIMVPVSLLNIYLYYNETTKFAQGNYDLSALLTLAIPVFLILAARGIYKDQKLVKSVDRLR